ncbi:fluoride efflux transporter CrcB [Streptomyces sp. DSM 41014]|uniref:Fluoride-specific ion channel FluC n=1 Tax=Streptomyces hintoniae TaxID=3075521 RepID=A0ABU2UHG6_9ACTN|nr:fluoride efflux transporter CrcB [Streptomyces sp. DSM 41014]MDT0472411.1 fluoride efflux transporter CrcB [Streptomyces sp. DSM 41014]
MTSPETESPRTPSRPVRRADWRGQAPIVAVIALGGALGACARYAIALHWPAGPGGFPWGTFWTNVAGCAAIGVLMVVITDVWVAHRLVRPFFGTGVLGGFTTFSTYAVDIQRLVDGGHARVGLAYLAATLLAALTAVQVGATLARRALKWRQS